MAIPCYERSITPDILPHDVYDILSTDSVLCLFNIDAIYPILGGVAHRVYCIESNQEKLFLKIRGDHFMAIPSIECNPEDIANEYLALELFSEVAPNHFPGVITFNHGRHYLVVTDVVRDGEKLDDVLARGEYPEGLFELYGQTLALIQQKTATITQPIRADGDKEYYRTVLGHRFGYRHHPVLDAAVEQLSVTQTRQLIMADPAPKNMGIRNNYSLLTFFDLETAHQGNPEFDYVYGIAHTLLHTMPVIGTMQTAVQQFLNGYGEVIYDQKLIRELVLGVILYRLNSIIPYPIALSVKERQELEIHLERMLFQITGKESWEEIINRITEI